MRHRDDATRQRVIGSNVCGDPSVFTADHDRVACLQFFGGQIFRVDEQRSLTVEAALRRFAEAELAVHQFDDATTHQSILALFGPRRNAYPLQFVRDIAGADIQPRAVVLRRCRDHRRFRV
jgi:hypothetical protein